MFRQYYFCHFQTKINFTVIEKHQDFFQLGTITNNYHILELIFKINCKMLIFVILDKLRLKMAFSKRNYQEKIKFSF